MALSLSTAKVTKQLCHIPLPLFKLKMLVKQFQYNDRSRRGGICDTTLVVLYNESDDLVFYVYAHDFEAIMDKYAKDINEIQERLGNSSEIQAKLTQLNDEIEKRIEELFNLEISQGDQVVSPVPWLGASPMPVDNRSIKVITRSQPGRDKPSQEKIMLEAETFGGISIPHVNVQVHEDGARFPISKVYIEDGLLDPNVAYTLLILPEDKVAKDKQDLDPSLPFDQGFKD